MVFLFGVLCGVGIALVVRGVLLAVRNHLAVEKADAASCATATKGWQRTRNFLYYDGTVMPTSKEDIHE